MESGVGPGVKGQGPAAPRAAGRRGQAVRALPLLAALVLAAGCVVPTESAAVSSSSAPPVVGADPNASYRLNRGLLTNLAADGSPITSGPSIDPLIIEARRFYDT